MKTTKHALVLALGLITLAIAGTAHASSVSYTFAGTLASPVNGTTSVTGTFAVDSATGNLTSYDFFDGTLEYNSSNSTESTGIGSGDEFFNIDTPGCLGSLSQCAGLFLPFTFTSDYATGLSFIPTSDLASQSIACFIVDNAFVFSRPSGCFYVVGTYSSGYTGGKAQFSSGSAVASAASVPEPSSLFLLGSGLVAVACAAKKRLRRS